MTVQREFDLTVPYMAIAVLDPLLPSSKRYSTSYGLLYFRKHEANEYSKAESG